MKLRSITTSIAAISVAAIGFGASLVAAPSAHAYIYRGYYPSPSAHPQIHLGNDAYGRGIFLDSGW